MPKSTGLQKIGGTYRVRVKVPSDIRDTFGKWEVTRSLGTGDLREARRLYPAKLAEIHQQFERHRQELERAKLGAQDDVTPAQLERIRDVYFHYRLEDDEETRQEGFELELGHPNRVQVYEPRPTFDEYEDDVDAFSQFSRKQYARREPSEFHFDEAAEVLQWSQVNIKLVPGSPAWKKVALAICEAEVAAYDAIKRRQQGDVVPTPREPSSMADSAVAGTDVLSKLVKDWVAEKKRGAWVEKTAQEHETWLRIFISLAGDRPPTDYKKSDARQFKNLLLGAPRNWMKRRETKGLSLADAVRKGQELGLEMTSVRNVNKILTMVGSFWTWAEANIDDDIGNPFRGLRIKERTDPRADRDSFSVEQLNVLFKSPLFTGCQSLQNLKKPGTLSLRDTSKFWVPLIGVFTGMRIGEIIQLYTEDIREESGVWVIDVNADGEGKRLWVQCSVMRVTKAPVSITTSVMGGLSCSELGQIGCHRPLRVASRSDCTRSPSRPGEPPGPLLNQRRHTERRSERRFSGQRERGRVGA